MRAVLVSNAWGGTCGRTGEVEGGGVRHGGRKKAGAAGAGRVAKETGHGVKGGAGNEARRDSKRKRAQGRGCIYKDTALTT